MLTQKAFVRKAYDRYKNLDLKPGDPNDGCWEKAHYPLPQPEGKRWIWLLREDHYVQGIIQSEEAGRCCFFAGDCKPYLQSNWCDDWFEIFDLYQKWIAEQGRQNGLKNVENKTGFCNPKNIDAVRAGGRKGAKNQSREDKQKAARRQSKEAKSKGGQEGCKNTNSQKWMSLETGLISHSGGVATHHKRLGADPKSRIQLTNRQYQILKAIPQGQRLERLPQLFK